MKPLHDWTAGDATTWLSTSPELAKYAANEIEVSRVPWTIT